MTILLLEEDPLLRSAITRELTEQGVPADRIHYHAIQTTSAVACWP